MSKLNERVKSENLEVEKFWVYVALMLISGFYGAFTYTIRGGVFSNAQTANFVLMAIAFGNKQWAHALYFIIPISAYLFGIIISEVLYDPMRKLKILRWETVLIFIEIVVVIVLGLLPESAPFQISQIAINFICSMQFNTFRQTREISVSTTFCTNHLKGMGNSIVKFYRDGKSKDKKEITVHFTMIFVFVIGAIISTVLCNKYLGRAILITLIPLGILFLKFLYADLKKERDKFDIVPRGH